jgi:hypothetical protein
MSAEVVWRRRRLLPWRGCAGASAVAGVSVSRRVLLVLLHGVGHYALTRLRIYARTHRWHDAAEVTSRRVSSSLHSCLCQYHNSYVFVGVCMCMCMCAHGADVVAACSGAMVGRDGCSPATRRAAEPHLLHAHGTVHHAG